MNSALEALARLTPPRTHTGRLLSVLPPADFVGRELMNIRLGLGLSVEDLAELAGLFPHQVHYIEGGAHGFDARTQHYPDSLESQARITEALHRHIVERIKRNAQARCRGLAR